MYSILVVCFESFKMFHSLLDLLFKTSNRNVCSISLILLVY